jgi:hypothetical protein
VFGTDGKGALDRLIKGQMDGIGTRPRLRAQAGDKAPLIDQSYTPDQVGDVGAALVTAGAWLRETQSLPSPRRAREGPATSSCGGRANAVIQVQAPS